MWLFFQNKLPLRKLLHERGLNIDARCPLCYDAWKDQNKIFMRCIYSRNVWNTVKSACPNPNNDAANGVIWVENLYKRSGGKGKLSSAKGSKPFKTNLVS